MNLGLLLLLLLNSCSPGLSPTDDKTADGCKDGYERNEDGNCEPAADNCRDGYQRNEDGNCEPTGNGDDDVDDSCTTDEDCTIDKCPDNSIGCICMEADGFCVPTCDDDADCPEVDGVALTCDAEGICAPAED